MFQPGFQLLLSDGTPDTRYIFEGQAGQIRAGLNSLSVQYADYPIAAAATCTLSPRGGCLGGTFSVPGSGIKWPLIEDNQIIRFLWNRHDDSSCFYRGRVSRGAERGIGESTHNYKLNGAWPLMASDFKITGTKYFGSKYENGTNSVRLCINTIFGADNFNIVSANLARNIVGLGSFASCDSDVKSITCTATSKWIDMFEQLELLAIGADATRIINGGAEPLKYFFTGVDHTGYAYFNQVTTANVAVTVQHGNNHAYRPIVGDKETIITRWPLYQVRAVGCSTVTPNGSVIKGNKVYPNPYLNSEPGIVQPKNIYLPGMEAGTDFEIAANAWFRMYGRRVPIIENLSFIADAPFFPWTGMVNFRQMSEDNSTLVEQKRVADSVQWSLAEGRRLNVTLATG